MSTRTAFRQRVREAVADERVVRAVHLATWHKMEARAESMRQLRDPEAICELAARIKQHTLENLPRYLEQFVAQVERSGGRVHFAADADAARRQTAAFEAKRLGARWAHLQEALSTCIRCNACRQACPTCYCKECLLKPEKMGYSSERYLRRAQKKGQIKMPVDTVLYHLTKMNHMASSCVACGLCEQACPMDIPLGRIYSRVGRHVQALFDYVPGRSLDEELPVTTFKEEELPQAEDIKR